MALFPGTYIPTEQSDSETMNLLIDEYLNPRLAAFRQIKIYDEPCEISPDDSLTWSATWGGWLEAAPLRVRKNSALLSSASVTNIDYEYGTFQTGAVDVLGDGRAVDTVEVTYIFDYFPVAVLEGMYKQSVSTVNTSAFGPPTSYTVDTAPDYWYGVMTDLTFAQCMQRLLLDYDLWKTRLLFAIGPNDVDGGGGDIVGQLETLKANAENMASKTLENEKFKSGNYVSVPTGNYYASIRGGGASYGRHGVFASGGRTRGWKPSRLI